MTVAVLPIGATKLGCAPANRGLSSVAVTLCELFEDVLDTRTSVALGERFRALVEAAGEALEHDWDGYGARAIDMSAFGQAKAFLRALPTAIPEPEISVETGGHVALDWYRGPRRAFTITIRGDGEINYATLFGRDRTYGTAQFVEEIPEPVALLLGRFLARR